MSGASVVEGVPDFVRRGKTKTQIVEKKTEMKMPIRPSLIA